MPTTHDSNLEIGQAWALQHARGEVEGLFGPESMLWQISREMVLMLAGGRALVLQLAHPAVCEGVASNSRFRNNLIRRARRTFSFVFSIFFGDLQTAKEAGAGVHRIHSYVRGDISAATCPERAGEPYVANDPHLLLWVMATLVDSSVVMFERTVRPLTLAETEAYYQDYRLFGAMMGIPPEEMPPTWPAFRTWFNGMLHGDELYVGDTLRELCHDLFNSPLTASRIDEIVTLGMLPESLHSAIGYPWNKRTKARHAAMMVSLRRSIPHTPAALRFAPAWHQACERIDVAHGRTPTRVSRTIRTLDRWVDIPFSLGASKPT